MRRLTFISSASVDRPMGAARVVGRIGAGVAALASAVLLGCGPSPSRDLANPDPAGKIPAIKQAVQRGDRSALPQLVEDLSNDDPAIRMAAIVGLRRLTGQDFGYLFFLDKQDREPAVRHWQEWLARQGR